MFIGATRSVKRLGTVPVPLHGWVNVTRDLWPGAR